MHISDLDLNLLRIFDAVYRQRSVSRAAEALALSQPAVSQGLTRLRLVLKDALFTRAGRGVAPTPNADALAHAVQQALQLVGEALQSAERFDPSQARRTFRIHMSDIGEAEFLPGLMHHVRRRARRADRDPAARLRADRERARHRQDRLRVRLPAGRRENAASASVRRALRRDRAGRSPAPGRAARAPDAGPARLRGRAPPHRDGPAAGSSRTERPRPAEHAALHGDPGDRRRDRPRRRAAAAHRDQVRSGRPAAHRAASLGRAGLRRRAALELARAERPGEPLAARAGDRHLPRRSPATSPRKSASPRRPVGAVRRRGTAAL